MPSTIRTQSNAINPSPTRPPKTNKIDLFIACTGCERTCKVSSAPPNSRLALGLSNSTTDTFLPTQCYECEQASCFKARQLDNLQHEPRNIHPSYISASILQSWWVYKAISKSTGGTPLISSSETSKLVVRQADFATKIFGDGVRVEECVLAKSEASFIRLNYQWRVETFFQS